MLKIATCTNITSKMNLIYTKWIELFSTCLASLRNLNFGTVTTIFKTKEDELDFFGTSRYKSGAPNENIVQNYLNIALLNVF